VTVREEDFSRTVQLDRMSRHQKPRTEATMKAQKDDALLTPAEVAALFRVDPKTVTRWAKAGKLSSIRTLGGHRRYRADEVKRFLEGAMKEA
jgi:excisionase family DNA binding protein